MRKPLIAGNWKMNLGRVQEARDFVRRIQPGLSQVPDVDVALCPPFTVLPLLAEILGPSPIALGAQNMHWEEKGAHTGEISPTMLQGLCDYVIIGHSERRATASQLETDEAIKRKVRSALEHGLIPILCVGERLDQRQAGETERFVAGQVAAALAGLEGEEAARCVIAYEPIWAIGTGEAATPAEANRVSGLVIRGQLAQDFGEVTAQQVRVLYGGSVTVQNIAEFMRMPEVDGALVGGASLKESFVELVRLGAEAGAG
jgi:triosephosphate isomerase